MATTQATPEFGISPDGGGLRGVPRLARPGGLGRLGRVAPLLGDLTAGALALPLLALGTPVDARVAVAVPLLWMLLVAASRADAGIELAWHQRLQRVLRAGSVLALGCYVTSTLTTAPATPRQLLALTAGATAGSCALRLLRPVWHRFGGRTASRTRVLVMGEPTDIEQVLVELSRSAGHSFDVVSTLPIAAASEGEADEPSPLEAGALAHFVADARVDAVIALPGRSLGPTTLRRLGWLLASTEVQFYLGTGVVGVRQSRTTDTRAGDLGLLHVDHPGHARTSFSAKGLWERPAAAGLLLLLSPVLLLLALAVRLDSPGRAIFRQVRVGRGGATFTMYKFRTMRSDAEEQVEELAEHNESDGLLFKVRRDPRITRLGWVLRRYSLDEVPQLANVVLGHMSLVGPRPALPTQVALYDDDLRRRLLVKPGLTGLWQVSGRSDLCWDDTVRLDLDYVDNWSMGRDLAIVGRTVRAVLGHRGAY